MRAVASLIGACLALGACGSSEARPVASIAPITTKPDTTEPVAVESVAVAPAPETEPDLPVTLIDDTGTEVTITSVDRIVPVDGDLAEIVFALGLGNNVVATDLSATYPAEADVLPEIGYQRALNPEPIAAMEPTVVLATDLARPTETLDQLRDLGIPVIVIERKISLDGPTDKVQAVADGLGVPLRGQLLVAQMQREIGIAVDSAPSTGPLPRVLALYLRGERVQLILGKGSGVDVLLPAVGAVDVAAELGVIDTQQITAEALLVANPDVLLVTSSGLESVGGIDGLLLIPGIAQTTAGKQGRVLAYEDQYLLGAGPRTGQLMAELVADLHP